MFLGRADYDDLRKRQREQTLEFPWAPSASRPGAATVGLILGSGNYGPPPGFDWDVYSQWSRRAVCCVVLCCGDSM